jgi:hypothetical protein
VSDVVLSNSQEPPRSEFATSDQRTAVAAREWLKAGRRVVGATLIEVEGSAPLHSGAIGALRSEARASIHPRPGEDRSPLPTFSSTR